MKNHVGTKKQEFRSKIMHNCAKKRRNVLGEMIPLTEKDNREKKCNLESE